MNLTVGTTVRIERDEARYPSRGTWPQFRGKTGTVVEINHDGKHPHLTEYGVSFGNVRSKPSSTGSISNGHGTVWFKGYELTLMAVKASERPISRSPSASSVKDPREAVPA